MRLAHIILGSTLLLASTLAACGRDQGPDSSCILQMQLVASRQSAAVSDSVVLVAIALPMLPPGYGCGQPTLTWSLSDSSVASLAQRSNGQAVLNGLRAGDVTVHALGKASGHQDLASVTVTFTP